jgi:hypothetical protein
MKIFLTEEKYTFHNLDSDKQDKIYDIFKKSYESSVGVSWSKDKFFSRAKNWLFFGDENGFVTVRVQQSGMYKLTGVAGNTKSIINGLNELQSINVPIWGMVSKDIQNMATKKGLKTPPSFLIKILIKFIPSSVFGGVDFDVNSDGSLTMKYSDVGESKKYFIANDEYFKKIKKDFLPQIKEKLSDLPLLARKSIEMFLNESKQETELKEDITSGSVIVYHRTGKKGSPVYGIAADGYRVGTGSMYGNGVYSTYDLQSQLNDNMRSTYGNIIIESKVLSMKDFLIFDYDMSKKIYGNKNYTLSRQLRLILGNEIKHVNVENLEQKLNVTKYTSDVALDFIKSYKNTISTLRGIVFTGSNDGKVLVSYDRKNVEPLRYTLDEGKTWKNIINKNIYKRLKGYDDDSKNLKNSHILNKMNVSPESLTNDEILNIINNEKLFNYLNDSIIYKVLINSKEPEKIISLFSNRETLISNLSNDIIKDMIQNSTYPEKVIDHLGNKGKEFISNLTDYQIKHILNNSKEPINIINALGNKGFEFISNLRGDDIEYVIQVSKNYDKIIEMLLDNEIFVSNLDSLGLEHLFGFTENPKKIYDTILTNETFISNLDGFGIETLLQYAQNNQRIYNFILTNETIISNLDSVGLMVLLQYSSDHEKVFNTLGNRLDQIISKLNNNDIYNLLYKIKQRKIIYDKILNNETIISNLNLDGIYTLLLFSENPDSVINILLNNETFISNLNTDGIYYLLRYTIEPENVINKLGNKGIQYISKLNNETINNLLQYSNVPKKLINSLGNKGKEYISKLDRTDILNIILNSDDPYEIIDMLGDKGKEYISKLDRNDVYRLRYSKKPEKVKEILLKLRPDLFDTNLQENIKRIKRLM